MGDRRSTPQSHRLQLAAPAGHQRIQSAYIHIPFCRRRCFYCDFPIAVVGDRPLPGTAGAMGEYVSAVIREIEIAATRTTQTPLNTVFFGGGTPSLLPVRELERLLRTLDRTFGIDAGAEIAIEMDPGTFDLAQVEAYRTLGVNRVSVGAQAFQDELLALCGRSHRTADIFAAVDLLRQGSIENLSLDLISGLPHQSAAQWQESLQQAIALAPQHFSCYDLIVEAGTPFRKQYEPGEGPLPSDAQAAEMYRQARELLVAAGYEHYEISNYARPGWQCHHNRTYWELRPFYGFGMGAASYWHDRRFTRPRTRREYFAWVDAWETDSGALAAEPDDPLEQMLEGLMLGLRLADGIDLGTFPIEYLPALNRTLQPHRDRDWVVALTAQGVQLSAKTPLDPAGRLSLSDPEGFLFSNSVLADLFAAFEDSEP